MSLLLLRMLQTSGTGARYAAIGVVVLLVAGEWHVSAERLPITRFTAGEGLAHNRIGRIVQDSHGFMWFCSVGGLSRYDGHSFVNYGALQGLSHEPVNDLLQIGDVYWIATNGGGIVRFDPHPPDQLAGATTPFRSTRLGVGDSAATNRVNVLYRDSSGSVWAGTDGGLFRLSSSSPDSGFQPVPLQLQSHPDQAVQVWALVEDGEKNLWIGSRFGLLERHQDGRVAQYTIQRQASTDHVWALLSLDRRLWLGHESGLVVFRPPAFPRLKTAALEPRSPGMAGGGIELPDVPGDARRYSTDQGLPADSVRAITRSSSGSVWIGTVGGGLVVFRDGRFQTYTGAHGLSDMFVTAIAEDRAGNTWIGTRNGAMRIARLGFITYGESDGLGPSVGTVFERDGVLYATSHEYSISRFDGTRFTKVRLLMPPGASGWRNQSILGDRRGEWWVGTRDGVFRFPRVHQLEQLGRVQPAAVYSARDGLADNDVASLFEDSHGDIWMAHFAPGQEVLTRWERSTNTFHRYSDRHGLRPFSQVTAFGETASGELWVGFRDGEVARYSVGRFLQEIPPDPRPERRVNAIHDDGDGRIWVSILGRGLVRLEYAAEGPDRMRVYTASDGLASNNVGVLARDSHGEIYIAVGHTIDRLDPRTGAVRHFTSSDGVPDTDFLGACRDRSGSLWFATTRGLLRFTPGVDPPPSSPDVRIGSLLIAGAPVVVPPLGARELGPFVLSPDRNRVTLDFFGLSSALDEGLRYQYRLEGAGDEWTAPTPQRTVTYANLAPGRYRFAVRAISKQGSTSDTSATVTFSVLPPIWRRWWFLSTAALVAGLLILFVHRYRLQRAIELERVRMHIATDLHDDIGAGLSQVAVLSAVVGRRAGSDPALTQPLSTIGELSRELVDSMSDIVWAINPRRDHASDLTHRMRRFASEVLGARDIDLTFTADSDDEEVGLGPDVRRQVWLIFKETVNNIARHSGSTRAEVSVSIGHHRLDLRLSDNGRGFDVDAAGDGNGLPSMRQRAARVGGKLAIESKRGHGTVVTFSLPIGHRFWHRVRSR